MRSVDLSPLFRASVGFDRLADLMERMLTAEQAHPGYPPYNIEKLGENSYRIALAVAGFALDELTVEVKDNTLVVAGRKKQDDSHRVYLYRGIATRAFERRFHLAEHVRVTSATHVDGMLHIDLIREVPEESKPRRIEIRPGKFSEPRAFDTGSAAPRGAQDVETTAF